jgi:ParB family chromosome partitioning protein
MSEYQNNSIFWVETSKIQPNPFQPRREFEPKSLEDLADSIRQYGILQPLTVTRKETLRPDGEGMDVSYELIAGERRLRASKLAGLQQVPVIIRKETNDKVKLELAIIENLQREDLNPVDRALAFEQLYKQFKLTHVEIGKRMGKSRVYVSNTLRLLSLPEEIKQGLLENRISEGHTRPLLMLTDRPEQQNTLYKEIMVKKMSVRDAEKVARKIAQDRVRKKEFVVDPEIQKYEKQLSENLGTRVHIEPKENGGQITIDYFTTKDLEQILESMKKVERDESMMDSYLNTAEVKKESVSTQVQEQEIEASTAISFKESEDQSLKTPTFTSEITSPPVPTSELEVPIELKTLSDHLPDVLNPADAGEEPQPLKISHAQEELRSWSVEKETQNQAEVAAQYVPSVPEQTFEQALVEAPVQPPRHVDPGYHQAPGHQETYQKTAYSQNPQQQSYYQEPQATQQRVHYQQQPVRKKGFFGRIFG